MIAIRLYPEVVLCNALPFGRLNEAVPVNWMILSAMWLYDLCNAVAAALPSSQNTYWTTSPLMGYVYDAVLTAVSSRVQERNLNAVLYLYKFHFANTPERTSVTGHHAFHLGCRRRTACGRLAVVCSTVIHAGCFAPLRVDGRGVGNAAFISPDVANQGLALGIDLWAACVFHPPRCQLRVTFQLRSRSCMGLHNLRVLRSPR